MRDRKRQRNIPTDRELTARDKTQMQREKDMHRERDKGTETDIETERRVRRPGGREVHATETQRDANTDANDNDTDLRRGQTDTNTERH